MKKALKVFLPIILIVNMFFAGCDQGAVLIDEIDPEVITDSLRLFSNIPDSIEVDFTTTADWTAAVASGGSWCSISASAGKKGKNQFIITVSENPTTVVRQTSVILESGNVKRIFKIVQKAGEKWFDTQYWDRTTSQRLGLRGNVKSMIVSDNRIPFTRTYTFDESGNLLKYEYEGIEMHRNDTCCLFSYDSDNHRIGCTVLNSDSVIVREWMYEYENNGSYVAFDNRSWLDENPASDDFSGTVVRDLSASHKVWNDGGCVFHEDRTYTFVEEYKLEIITDRWKEGNEDEHIRLSCDTTKVSYKYFNSCKLSLPCTSREVYNTDYSKNGMVRMFMRTDCKYDFMENHHVMAVSAYTYTGNDAADKDIDWYKITYNYNRDILEREVQYHGYSSVKDQYSKYQYDSDNNWQMREEDIIAPGNTEAFAHYSRRDFTYFE